MAAVIPAPVREAMRDEAFALDIKRINQSEIARRLSEKYRPVTRQAVNRLIQERRRIALREADQEARDALAELIATNKAVEQDCWQTLEEIDWNARTRPAVQANILEAAKSTGTALGLMAGKGADAANITINLNELMQQAVIVQYADQDDQVS